MNLNIFQVLVVNILLFSIRIEGLCIKMPTEKIYREWSYHCEDLGFPDKSTCPYDYPYLDQVIEQVGRIGGSTSFRFSCESTKICCEYI